MIVFRKANELIEIATSGVWTWSWMARIPKDDFVDGCHRFLREIVAAIEANASSLLQWESFEPLLAFSSIQDQ